MLIAVAGPYSAPTAEQMRANLDAMNAAAAEVMRRGHIPVIGVDAALPVVEMLAPEDRYEAIMAISLEVVGRCDAILMIGESPGANRERDLLASKGRPVFSSLDEIPPPTSDRTAVAYRSVLPQDYEPVRLLLAASGWQDRVADEDRFKQMLDRAHRAVVAYEGERIVGFIRALGDGVSNGYISMLVVAEDRRRRGIGRELVRRLTEEDGGELVTWVLRAGRGSTDFWKRTGFTPSKIAMQKLRSR